MSSTNRTIERNIRFKITSEPAGTGKIGYVVNNRVEDAETGVLIAGVHSADIHLAVNDVARADIQVFLSVFKLEGEGKARAVCAHCHNTLKESDIQNVSIIGDEWKEFQNKS